MLIDQSVPSASAPHSAQPRHGTMEKTVHIQLKKHGIDVQLNVPDLGDKTERIRDKRHYRVLQAHTRFKSSLVPGDSLMEEFAAQCQAEVDVVELVFPALSSEQLRISFAAWLAYVCAADDILETLSPAERKRTIQQCISILKMRPVWDVESRSNTRNTHVQHMTRVFRRQCLQYLPRSAIPAFFKSVRSVLRAFIDESNFLKGGIDNTYSVYMSIRRRTISFSPLFETIKHLFLPEEWLHKGIWERLERQIFSAAGLQSDLIGFEGDSEDGEQLNAVRILLQQPRLGDTEYSNADPIAHALVSVAKDHNDHISRVLRIAGDFTSAERNAPESVILVMQLMVTVCETHLSWVATAKRYRIAPIMDKFMD